jgi:hypothetical protein
MLQLLHCLRGKPGINRFIGVVLDEDGIISGLLCDLPAKGRIFSLMQQARDFGSSVTWKRRENGADRLYKLLPKCTPTDSLQDSWAEHQTVGSVLMLMTMPFYITVFKPSAIGITPSPGYYPLSIAHLR